MKLLHLGLLLCAQVLFGAGAVAQSGGPAAPIVIGLDADMSSGSAQSGEAIRRGADLAIAEINAAGGVLGRPLRLEVRDHRGNPARGKDNIREFAEMADLVAVIGGIHTPVALAELDLIHEHEIVYLGAWAAGTPVVENGRDPNYVFRVSVRDEFAGGYLLKSALARGFRRPGLLLERTGWGRSNEAAFSKAARDLGVGIADVQWFHWGIEDLRPQILALSEVGADVVMLVANPSEGAVAIRSMAELNAEQRLPIISHWGITGGDFPALVNGELDQVDLEFLQTYSFLAPTIPERAEDFLKAYFLRFPDTLRAAEIRSPVGTAHAYDLVRILAGAIERARSTNRSFVRAALERSSRFEGLLKDYDPPFTRERHDALTADDLTLARYLEDGTIQPVGR
jgi:branched-chain amino acid transport system substrate-binding protein